MTFRTINVSSSCETMTVQMNRIAQKNAINDVLVDELNTAIESASADPNCKILVLEGGGGFFCTGMDFSNMLEQQDSSVYGEVTEKYMRLLKNIALAPCCIISKVDGQTLAGGVGLVAASDLVVATPKSTFGLSEAMWGLLPSMVIPYLIRRVGFHKAYTMTLTTANITAEEALQCELVDNVTDDADLVVRRMSQRLLRLQKKTIAECKEYFRSAWIIDSAMESRAVKKTTSLVNDPVVRQNIEDFVKYRIFPWNKD